jgi:hypothetical protein
VIENARDNEIHEIPDAGWPVVKPWCRGEDHRTGSGDAEHVLEVYDAQRRLARNKNESATLLERDIRRPLDE